MKKIIYVDSYRRDLVFIARHKEALCTGFLAEITIDLPFAPYPGLSIELAGRSENGTCTCWKLEKLCGTIQEKQFACIVETIEDYETFDDMRANADEFAASGFTRSQQ